MKFFIIVLLFIAISNSPSLNWVYLYDVRDILAPSHRLYYPYSKHQNQLPRNASPNTFYQVQGILVGEAGKTDLSTFSQEHLYSVMAGILYACGYGLCLLHLSIFEHFHYHIFESVYLCTFLGRPLSKHDIDTLSPIQYGNLNYLLNASYSYIEPFSKFKTFIETKVTAMKLQGFNLNLENKYNKL